MALDEIEPETVIDPTQDSSFATLTAVGGADGLSGSRAAFRSAPELWDPSDDG
jgi:hypothetical protein